jgi:hypothetical protein
MVAEELAAVGNFAIASHAESVSLGMLHHTVCSIDLCLSGTYEECGKWNE